MTYAGTAVLVVLTVVSSAGLAGAQTKNAAPPLPSNLWAAQTSPTQITLGWGRATVPLGSDPKLASVSTTTVPVAEYRIYRDRGDGRLERVAILSGAATTAVMSIDGRGSGGGYQYAIAAFGKSKTPISRSASPAATARFNPVMPQSGDMRSMDAPSVTAVQTGPSEITVSWSEVAGATAYRIGRNAGPKGFQTLCQLCPTDSMIVDRLVADATGGTYTYTVEAYTRAGLTKPGTSNPLVVTLKGLDASSGDSKRVTLAPTRLWAAQTAPREITLVWRPPDNVASGKNALSAYDIYEERDGGVRRVTRLSAAATRAVVAVAHASTGPQQFSIAAVPDRSKGSTPRRALVSLDPRRTSSRADRTTRRFQLITNPAMVVTNVHFLGGPPCAASHSPFSLSFVLVSVSRRT
jgi:hypothetical protein